MKPKYIRMTVDEFNRRLEEQFTRGFNAEKTPTLDSATLEMVAMVTRIGDANAQLTVSAAKLMELCKRL